MAANVINFGCRVNAYEAEIIKKNSEKLGGEYFILNSCAVTNEAEQDLVRQMKKIRKENPDGKIILTGCVAQITPEKYAQYAEFVLGNAEKLDEDIYNKIRDGKFEAKNQEQSKLRYEDKVFYQNTTNESLSNLMVGDIMAAQNFKAEEIIEYDSTRAIVQVQNGCNHRCTFCVIPYGRGNSRSVPVGGVVATIKTLVEKGFKEVVLTGIDLTDYGKDLPIPTNLSSLVARILTNVPNLPRLRLSSIDVAEIDEMMFEILKSEPRFMPFFHLSLQAGDDMILKRMKRRHTRKQVIDFCNKARTIRANIGLGADIIAGFPTEDELAFQNSWEIIKECNIAFGHIFPFSPKSGTPAAKMPQIERSIIKKRVEILRNEAKNQMDILKKAMIGTLQNVLTERNNKGKCENFISVDLQNVQHKDNEIIVMNDFKF